MECKTRTAIEVQMQQTIDQLRANAKSHKKTVDNLSAKVSQLTIENNELRGSKKKATNTELMIYATAAFLFGFLATAGAICAYGWFLALGRLIN